MTYDIPALHRRQSASDTQPPQAPAPTGSLGGRDVVVQKTSCCEQIALYILGFWLKPSSPSKDLTFPSQEKLFNYLSPDYPKEGHRLLLDITTRLSNTTQNDSAVVKVLESVIPKNFQPYQGTRDDFIWGLMTDLRWGSTHGFTKT